MVGCINYLTFDTRGRCLHHMSLDNSFSSTVSMSFSQLQLIKT